MHILIFCFNLQFAFTFTLHERRLKASLKTTPSSKSCQNSGSKLALDLGQEPWSNGYGRRLVSWRMRVRIPAPYTGRAFFTNICCKNGKSLFEEMKINTKEAEDGSF